MRAWTLGNAADTGALTQVERDCPDPGPGQVRLSVHAASLNYRDLLVLRDPASRRSGLVPLSDGAGTIAAAGPGVSHLSPGDRCVAAFMPHFHAGQLTEAVQAGSLGGGQTDGMLTEEILLPAAAVLPIPEWMTFEEAACLPCAGVTAWYALFDGASVKPGDDVLLLGTGGVSIFALQLAKLAGARVLITSSSAEKLRRASGLGADETVDYVTHPEWDTEILRLTEGRGCDVVVEVGGPGTLPRSLAATRFGGTVSLMGVLTGFAETVPTALILRKNIRIQGTYVGHVGHLAALLRAVRLHRLHPVVDRAFGWDEAPEAYRHLAAGAHFGKVVVTIRR